jgi:hypothetical protein
VTYLGRWDNEQSDHIKEKDCADKISASNSFSKVIQFRGICNMSANFMFTNFKFKFKTAFSEAMKRVSEIAINTLHVTSLTAVP